MKKTGVALLCLFTLSIFQSIVQNSEKKIPAFHRVDFISPGYRYEFPINSAFTGSAGLETHLFYGRSGSSFWNSSNNYREGWFLLTYAEAGAQWHYSDARRIRLEKSVRHHAGSYFNLSARYYIQGLNIPIYRDNVSGVETNCFTWVATWGIRRALGKSMVMDIYIGYEDGIAITYTGRLKPGIKLGWVF